MFDVILISHGPLSEAILEAAQLICGEQERVKNYGLYMDDSIDEFANRVKEGIEESLTHGDLVVLTDMQMGSPFNVACRAMADHSFYHVTGMNLPLVIQVLTDRADMNASEVVERAVTYSKASIVDVNELLAGVF